MSSVATGTVSSEVQPKAETMSTVRDLLVESSPETVMTRNLEASTPGDGLNAAWTHIVAAVTGRSDDETSTVITVDLVEGESAQDFSTRLQMLLLFMNRDAGSVSATVSPSFKSDTYPAMLSLVRGFASAGAGEEWRPDGPRSMRVGDARHLFVSVDMPVADRSPSPNTLIEIVSADRIDSRWYDQRVALRIPTTGMTTVMFGVPNRTDADYATSIFKRERARNLAGRPGGVHFSRESSWPASAAV